MKSLIMSSYDSDPPESSLKMIFSTMTPSSSSHNHTDPTPEEPQEYKNLTAVYWAIAFGVLGAVLILLNVILCCCSKYKKYWQDLAAGTRTNWRLPLWSNNTTTGAAVRNYGTEDQVSPLPQQTTASIIKLTPKGKEIL